MLLRAEALRQLHWQQRAWARVLAAHAPGTPCLIASAERQGFMTDWICCGRRRRCPVAALSSRVARVTTDTARGVPAGISLAGLLADLDRVLERFDPE